MILEATSMPAAGCGTSARVDAVVVTYSPRVAELSALLALLSPQVECIHVVDNTPVADARVEGLLGRLQIGNATLLRLGVNQGIAKALNVGIASAKLAGATHVLFSDQDSEPASDMVARLLSAYADLCAQDEPVGAIGPVFTDKYTGTTFPFQAAVPGKFFYGHVHPQPGRPVVEAMSLITSGTLVPMQVLDEVGAMREDLFIDKVDIEWCHRVRAAGWKLFGTGEARMFQRMGEADLRVWYFGWRRETAYPPLRLYYQARNFVALAREPWIQWRWKVRNGWYTLGVIYSQVGFGRHRSQAVHMALRGLVDGVRGRMGPYQPSRGP